ncbi:hypothetical protein DSM101010T_28500 [Desulfovibrio subterraneus]|uniref:Uncharacterized protein n=1 Tax=Desulfovibrio subterraneus TaxID=2718620 RepID=A0A7J0BMZ0_9BACT|nr:hypothetical protein DSM101010T_28500 [Desulfovibrio subterraneus]
MPVPCLHCPEPEPPPRSDAMRCEENTVQKTIIQTSADQSRVKVRDRLLHNTALALKKIPPVSGGIFI